MKNYLDLLRTIRDHGVRVPNRTGIDTLMIPGAMLRYDMADGFPAVTTKKLYYKAVFAELVGFIRGVTNAADFRVLGAKIWDKDANETASWVSNPNRKGTDDLGRIYGAQWRDWNSSRAGKTLAEAVSRMVTQTPANIEALRAELTAAVSAYERESHVDQLVNAVRTILRDPNSRRIIVSAWRPDELDQMALPPCHVMFQFIVDTASRRLHLCMTQRSNDTALGVPFNIASYAALLHIVARLTGYTPGTFTHFMADAHIYVNHLPAVDEQLKREPLPLPQLVLSDRIKKLESDDPSAIAIALESIDPSDLEIVNYQHHPAIAMEMAVERAPAAKKPAP